MDVHYTRSVRSDYEHKTPRELLESPVTVLVGVDNADREALSLLGIENVHNLATSHIFEVARAVTETAASGGPSGSPERIAADLALGNGSKSFSELARSGIDELEGVSESVAEEITTATGLQTVSDLARWPPYLAARNVLSELTGIGAETQDGVPKELVPTARKYATEQSFYTKVFIDELVQGTDDSDGEAAIGEVAEVEVGINPRRPSISWGADLEVYREVAEARLEQLRPVEESVHEEVGDIAGDVEEIDVEEVDAVETDESGDRDRTRVRAERGDQSGAGEVRERLSARGESRIRTRDHRQGSRSVDRDELERMGQEELEELTELQVIEAEFGNGREAQRQQVRNLLAKSRDRRVDLAGLDPDVAGFRRPAVGAVLQFSQSWVPQGLSLGQLLHSVTLAPGESTKMAVVDWSRRARGETDEAVGQQESLEAGMVQNRSIEEVQRGVVTELQRGSSMVSSESTTTQAGISAGGILGSFGFGGSASRGRTSSESSAVSTSRGRREVSAEMAQNIRSSTQQHASSSRTRRASVISETEQAESEEITTRVLTNYNHMHALTVHYYEVVQIFRVEVATENAQPVLFVPFKVLDFTNKSLIHRFRRTLRDAALDPYTEELIDDVTGYATVDLHSAMFFTARRMESIGVEVSDTDGRLSVPRNHRLTGVLFGPPTGVGKDNELRIRLVDGESVTVNLERGRNEIRPQVEFDRIDRVSLKIDRAENGSTTPVVAGLAIEEPGGGSAETFAIIREDISGRTTTLLEVTRSDSMQELIFRLNEERLHYSQAVWRNLDSQTIALLLSSFKIDAISAIELVDPDPVATHGNYVAFPMAVPESVDDADDSTLENLAEWWEGWRERNYDPGIGETDLVPLPSGGVYGEAILGRANAAEKLDLTRFWDWQESPIPHAAPEIAPIQAGSRARDESAKPGSLDAPMVQIQTPPSLPDPAGISSVMGALTSSGIFRDMSGLEAAAQIAQHGQKVSGEAASHAANMASQNYKAALEADIERMKQAGKIAAALTGGPAGAGAAGAAASGNSSFGGLLNEARKEDTRSPIRSPRTANGSVEGGSGDESGSSGGSSGGGGGTSSPSGTSRIPPSIVEDALRERISPGSTLFRDGGAGDLIRFASAGAGEQGSEGDTEAGTDEDDARQQWEEHRNKIGHHFHGFDGDTPGHHYYADVQPLYRARGIDNPAEWIAENIVVGSFLGHQTPVHSDLVERLERAQETLDDDAPTISRIGGFVPRRIRGSSRLSNHAFGRAVDIDHDISDNQGPNPHIRDAREIEVIREVTGVDLGQSQSHDAMREASQTFQETFGESHIQEEVERIRELEVHEQLNDAMRRELNRLRSRRQRLNSYAQHGFLNLPQNLIDALIAAGFEWGGDWTNEKDFMHFELPE